MTTNFTAIINENLDMFYDEADCFETEYEYSNGIGWEETEDGFEYEDEEITFTLADGTVVSDVEFLAHLRKEMATIVERCGVYGAEEYAELAAFYSDVHKDIYGFRPYDIGLRCHGFRE